MWLVAGFPPPWPTLGYAGLVGKVLGQVFSEYFHFPSHSFHRLPHAHRPLSGAGTLGHIVAIVPPHIRQLSSSRIEAFLRIMLLIDDGDSATNFHNFISWQRFFTATSIMFTFSFIVNFFLAKQYFTVPSKKLLQHKQNKQEHVQGH
jgi:hypothetical protein